MSSRHPVLHPSLAHVRAIVFDLDGVLYQERAPIAGGPETVRALASLGLPVRFLTNTTSISRNRIAEKLARFGYDAAPDQVFSPARAAARYLREHRLSAHLLVRSGALEDFDGVVRNNEDPGAVVVGDLADEWTYERMNQAFRLVHQRDAQLIGLGRSAYWKAERGLILDVGPYLAALEYATGKPALVFGKPEPAMFEGVVRDMGVAARDAAMIGDDLACDVIPAQHAGLRGVLVKTGKFEERDLEGPAAPDLVLDSVADLVIR